MIISDHIAKLIEEMLDEGGGEAELRRNDLAARLGCVPSQISYVITSRFTPARGYMTESRRGGGGYIKIVRIRMDKNKYLMHFFHAIGDSIDETEARALVKNLTDNSVISDNTGNIICSALSDCAFKRVEIPLRGKIRADMLRHIILSLIR